MDPLWNFTTKNNKEKRTPSGHGALVLSALEIRQNWIVFWFYWMRQLQERWHISFKHDWIHINRAAVVWCWLRWFLSPAASPLASLEEGDYRHAGAQKCHLLKIKDFHWPLMEWGRGWGVCKGSSAWAILVYRNQRNQGKLQIVFHV